MTDTKQPAERADLVELREVAANLKRLHDEFEEVAAEAKLRGHMGAAVRAVTRRNWLEESYNALPGLIAEVERLDGLQKHFHERMHQLAQQLSAKDAEIAERIERLTAEGLHWKSQCESKAALAVSLRAELSRLQGLSAAGAEPAATASRTVSDADELARDLAAEIVQSLSDSEPTGRSMEGMDKLRGTPLESMFVLDGDDIRSVAERIISNAIFDKAQGLSAAGAEWQSIETAPQDGTAILGWNVEFGARETKSETYQPGSPGHAQGWTDRWWRWSEPIQGWAHQWKPTHWRPLITPQHEGAPSVAEAAKCGTCKDERAVYAIHTGWSDCPDCTPASAEKKCACNTKHPVCKHETQGSRIFQVDDDCMHCGHKEACHAAADAVKPNNGGEA